jgi:hypothetical protein
MKKLTTFFLSGTATLALSSAALNAQAADSGQEMQQIAASIVDFLTTAMYPDSSQLAVGEENLLKSSETADKTAQSSNDDLVLSSLSSGISVAGASLVTQNGIQSDESKKNIAKQFSHEKMQRFLCGNGTTKCLYTAKHDNALIQTLTGSPYASDNGGLTAADTLITKSEADTASSVYNYGNTSDDDNKYTGSFDKSSYFDYNRVFGPHEPTSLEPAKYYGLFATTAYDVNLLNQQPEVTSLIKQALDSGNIYSLRNNPIYQRHILLMRTLTATNSALMGNILWLAKQHTVTVKKEDSPTKEAMSQAQADKYIGNHRLNDGGDWVTKIKNESATELLREQTLMMAEANHQREENNEIMKRMLATVTILTAENKELYKLNLALQEKLDKK